MLDATYPDSTKIDLYFVFVAVAALLTAAAAVVILLAWADSRRGPTRARWLQAGVAVLGLAYVAATVALLFEQAYWSGLGGATRFAVPSEFTTGALVAAIGSFGLAVGAAVFVRGARRALGRREAALFAAAGIAVVATLCVAAGEVLIAYGYRDGIGSVQTSHWLEVGGRVVSALGIVFVALGARAAAARGPERDEAA